MAWEPDYASVDELKSFMRIPALDTEDDAELGFAVTDASRAVDEHTHRQFGQVAAVEARRYTAVWNRRRCRWVVNIDDLQDITGLDMQIDAGPVTVFRLEPVNAAQEGRPFERLIVDEDEPNQPTGEEFEVAATALWGWTAVPVAIKNATLMQANRFHNRRTSPFGIAGSPETGSELRLLTRLDPDVAVSIKKYVRDRVRVG